MAGRHESCRLRRRRHPGRSADSGMGAPLHRRASRTPILKSAAVRLEPFSRSDGDAPTANLPDRDPPQDLSRFCTSMTDNVPSGGPPFAVLQAVLTRAQGRFPKGRGPPTRTSHHLPRRGTSMHATAPAAARSRRRGAPPSARHRQPHRLRAPGPRFGSGRCGRRVAGCRITFPPRRLAPAAERTPRFPSGVETPLREARRGHPPGAAPAT